MFLFQYLSLWELLANGHGTCVPLAGINQFSFLLVLDVFLFDLLNILLLYVEV